jgi:hypothetical protein
MEGVLLDLCGTCARRVAGLSEGELTGSVVSSRLLLVVSLEWDRSWSSLRTARWSCFQFFSFVLCSLRAVGSICFGRRHSLVDA